MESLIEFFSFTDANIRFVVFGSMLLAASSAMVGVFIVLRKKALVGDAVSHGVLPGICAAFLIFETKNIVLLIIGAFISGWLSLVLIDWIVKRTKVKKDAAIGLVLTVFFGFGIVLLTFIQHSGNSSQSGLDSFIFGKAAALVGNDLIAFAIIALVLIVSIVSFFKEFTLVSFDEPYAAALGLPIGKLELLLTTLTVLAVVTGITAVGVVLMAAMLITPAAAARFWTDDLRKMMVLSALFGAVSGLLGAYISFVAPAMPTGPWMVVVSSFIAFFSFFFAPKVGIISRSRMQKSRGNVMLEENILKIFYQRGERENDFGLGNTAEELLAIRPMQKNFLKKTLQRLYKKNLLIKEDDTWYLSHEGILRSARVVKLHRLWELYLTKYADMSPEHVHENAELIEHIITPELEMELEHQLGFPEKDPHNSIIPRI
jgi:manganese/zinc/iron transport system permease protein